MLVDPHDLHAIEVRLRDSRNMGVIMALTRLTQDPKTQDELHNTIRNLGVVRNFIHGDIPDELKVSATAIFGEYAQRIHKSFKAAQVVREANIKKD